MKTPISYYGGKQRLVPEILPLIPKHTQYVEPFCGGAAVFWAKEPSQHEVINDLDGRVVNFYRMLQQDFNNLQAMIQSSLNSESEYYRAKEVLKDAAASDLERAWAYWIQTQASFSNKVGGGFGFDQDGRQAGVLAQKKADFTAQYLERVKLTEIFSRDAVRLILLKDSPSTFFYIDPPYVSSECGHYKGYTSADFQRLLDTLGKIQGKFLLSSYPEPELLAARAAYGWSIKDIEATVAVSGKRKERKAKTECLTYNYSLAEQPIGLFAMEHLTA
jgi:DNA adenine methylase